MTEKQSMTIFPRRLTVDSVIPRSNPTRSRSYLFVSVLSTLTLLALLASLVLSINLLHGAFNHFAFSSAQEIVVITVRRMASF